jgi:hypothetical protein
MADYVYSRVDNISVTGYPIFYTKNVYKTSSASLTVEECSGTVVSNYGMTDADCLLELPTAEEGLGFLLVLPAVRAKYVHVKGKAGSGDIIYLSGVAGGSEKYVGVESGYATMTAASFVSVKASDGGFDWFCTPFFGTFVAEA